MGYPQPSGAMLPIWVMTEAKLDHKYGFELQNIYISGGARLTRRPRYLATRRPRGRPVRLIDAGHGIVAQPASLGHADAAVPAVAGGGVERQPAGGAVRHRPSRSRYPRLSSRRPAAEPDAPPAPALPPSAPGWDSRTSIMTFAGRT